MTRTKTIQIRLTNAEYRKLKLEAGTRGLSALVRLRALGPDRKAEENERLHIVAEVARTRNILNQLARRCATLSGPDQVMMLSQLVAVERQIRKLVMP